MSFSFILHVSTISCVQWQSSTFSVISCCEKQISIFLNALIVKGIIIHQLCIYFMHLSGKGRCDEWKSIFNSYIIKNKFIISHPHDNKNKENESRGQWTGEIMRIKLNFLRSRGGKQQEERPYIRVYFISRFHSNGFFIVTNLFF